MRNGVAWPGCRLPPIVAAGALVSLAACGPAPSPPVQGCDDDANRPLLVEMGTGSDVDVGWQPLSASGELPLLPGPQGGYHIYVQVRTTGFCSTDRMVVSWTFRGSPEGPVLRSQQEVLRFIDDGLGHLVLPHGQPTFVCPSLIAGEPMAGRPLDLEVRVTGSPEGDGAEPVDTALDHETVVPTCPDGDVTCSDTVDVGCAAPPA
jgi:hypothetical protein